MKQILFILTILVVVLSGCQKSSDQAIETTTSDDVVNMTGTVVKISDNSFGIKTDSEPKYYEQFLPGNLPENFKIDGCSILFSGKRGEIPPNVRLWGTPITLSSVQINIK
jgi:hypothetical protein